MINHQPTKELQYFQRMILQEKYIAIMQGWLDELEWEIEKKDTLTDMLEKEIKELRASSENQIKQLKLHNEKLTREFKEFTSKYKQEKRDTDKINKQQELIDHLKKENKSLEGRLQTRQRMIELMEKQAKKYGL